MTKHVDSLFAKGLIREEQRASWGAARDALNDVLDSERFLNVNGETLTNRTILEAVVFGGYAHANESKKKEFDSWQMSDPLFPVLRELSSRRASKPYNLADQRSDDGMLSDMPRYVAI